MGLTARARRQRYSIIAGVLCRDGGSVTLGGQFVGTRTVSGRRAIGLVPQDLALYPDLTGRENIGFFGRIYSLLGAELRHRRARCTAHQRAGNTRTRAATSRVAGRCGWQVLTITTQLTRRFALASD